MKKYILAICAVLLVNASVQASMLGNTDVHAIMDQPTMMQDCAKVTRMVVKEVPEGIELDYQGTNEAIHQCVYMKQAISKQCILSNTCMGYEEWTIKNAQFNVTMPRKEFSKYFEMHYLYQLPVITYLKTGGDEKYDMISGY